MDELLHTAAEYAADVEETRDAKIIVENRPQAPIPSTALVKNANHDEQLEVLGGGMRRMVDLISRLRASGVEDLGLPLPKIAVIGNQSAGKSSLIEAISGINVPRSSGTCTRCPLEIVLRKTVHPEEPWSCRVSLRFKCAYVRNKENPWELQQQSQQVHFTSFYDKGQVQEALLRAQTAILNPSQDWREYAPDYTPPYPQVVDTAASRIDFTKPMRKGDLEVMFSPNVVCMDITGPDLPDLSFIDLPGVIHNTEKHEEYLVPLVKKLVEGYVKEQDCLVLLAVTMRDDPENQSASSIAQRYAADRTIGALTKPDLIEPGEHSQWIDIIRGKAHRLHHGYFVTKQPNQRAIDAGIDSVQGRLLEQKFFGTTEPWCSELRDLKARFGAPALADYLSEALGHLIRSRLPTIRETINQQIGIVKMELMTLPAQPPTNHARLAEDIISEFEARIQAALEMKSVNTIRDHIKGLASGLGQLRPGLKLFEDPEVEAKAGETWKSDGKDGWFVENRPTPESPTKVRYITNGTDAMNTPQSGRKRPHGMEEPGNKRAKLSESSAIKYTLPQLAHIIDNASTSHIPGQFSTEAVNKIVRSVIDTWSLPIERLIQNAVLVIRTNFHREFIETFGRYEKTEFKQLCEQKTQSLLRQTVEHLKITMQELHNSEMEHIATVNIEDFAKAKAKCMETLKRRRAENLEDQKRQRRENERETCITAPIMTPRKSGPRNRGQNPPPRTLDIDEPEIEDKYTREIEVLATAHAYHELARKRFADNVYKCMLGKLLKTCREDLVPQLRDSLGLGQEDAEDRCRKLLAEDPAQERRRAELIGKKSLLENALRELDL